MMQLQRKSGKQDKDDLCWKGNNMACIFDEDNIQLNIQFDNKPRLFTAMP